MTNLAPSSTCEPRVRAVVGGASPARRVVRVCTNQRGSSGEGALEGGDAADANGIRPTLNPCHVVSSFQQAPLSVHIKREGAGRV
jgi:hypothetical protein